MTVPRVRITVRRLMAAIAAVAVPLSAIRVMWPLLVREGNPIVEMGDTPIIPLHFIVLDDETGRPIPGAGVDQPFLHSDWRGRPELKVGDLRLRHTDPRRIASPLITDREGRARSATKAMLVRRRFGSAGSPSFGRLRIEFHPVHGVRVNADGYETWVKFLSDIAREDGRRLGSGTPLPVVIRLKRKPADSPAP